MKEEELRAYRNKAIEKDRRSIENRLNHAFNQGYEIGRQMAKTSWIPCSERLPEAGEYVDDVAKYYLVQNEYGDMLVARYTHSGYWEQIYHLKPYADEIVAWMPLPQKYKEEGWTNE